MKMSGIHMVSHRGIKSKILVSIRVFLKKHHYFSLSKYLLGCTRRDNQNVTRKQTCGQF